MVRSHQSLVSVVVAVRPSRSLLFAFESAASSGQTALSFVAAGRAEAAASAAFVVESCFIYVRAKSRSEIGFELTLGDCRS